MTTIEWTQRPGTKGETWNPFAAFDKVTGKRGWICQLVSPGCANCYAQTFNRFRGNGHPYQAGELEKVRIELVNLDQPLRWRQPRTVFVCSMTDLFFEGYTDEQIWAVFHVMAKSPRHTFQVLTKRPERARALLSGRVWRNFGFSPAMGGDHCALLIPGTERNEQKGDVPFLPNVWLGTSVENQACADKRIPELLATPAAMRFLSCEPLLGPLDLTSVAVTRGEHYAAGPPTYRKLDALGGRYYRADHKDPWVSAGLDSVAPQIDWVIVGGESGPGARPCNVRHVHLIVEQCQRAGVAVFVKQLGAQPGFTLEDEEARGNAMPGYHHFDETWGLYIKRLDDRKGSDMSQWPEDLRVREWPQVEVSA